MKPTPFYSGQKVVAVDALPKSKFKNGTVYTVSECFWSINPVNGLGPFCYVGIVGHGSWFRPSIFAPLEDLKMPSMTLTKIKELEKVEVLCPN